MAVDGEGGMLAGWLVGRKEISRHLGVSHDTLDAWRLRYPEMPVYVIDGRLRALPSDLDTWLKGLCASACPVDGQECPRKVAAVAM